MVALSSRVTILGAWVAFIGSLTATLGSPRENFRRALLPSAANIIVGHNHASGDPEPSDADDAMTKRLRECGARPEVGLIDHIVIGDDSTCSSAMNGFPG